MLAVYFIHQALNFKITRSYLGNYIAKSDVIRSFKNTIIYHNNIVVSCLHVFYTEYLAFADIRDAGRPYAKLIKQQYTQI